MERTDSVTVKGDPLTLLGDSMEQGKNAPDFTALDADLKEVRLSDLEGGVKVIASVPSLDTPVCDLELKRFNKEAAELSGDVEVIFVSMDLPFAQKRFCEAFGIENVRTLSDHREADFGMKYGVLIKELRLLARAVFVIDREGRISYAEYVKELTSPPDYDKVLNAVKGAV